METQKTEWTEEDWQNLKLSDNFLFGYVMQNAEMARIFLESLLEIEIESVEHVETEDVVEIAPQFRGVRLDVRLKADGRLVNIEMQTTSNEDLPRRIRYYQALGDSQLLLRNTSFSVLPEFLTIFVCTFDPFKKRGAKNEDGLPLYTIRHAVEENPDILYDDGRRIMIFNTTAWKKSLAQNRKDMLKYIQCGNGKFESEKVSDFAAMVTDAKTKNLFRRNYMTLSLKIREMEMDAMDKGRKEGYDDGYDKGREAQLAADKTEIDRLKSLLAEHNIPV